MKTITIPTCANPLVVILNNKKYTYPAGETVSVPDEVAEVIERHEEAHPKPEEMPSEENTVTIEIATPAVHATTLTSEESAQLTDAWNKGKNVTLKANVTVANIPISNLVAPTMKGVLAGIYAAYAISFGATVVYVSSFVQNDGSVSGAGWAWQIME